MEKTAIYLVYSIEQYYPGAGLSDVVGIFDNESEARKVYNEVKDRDYKWKELVMIDLATLSHKTIAST